MNGYEFADKHPFLTLVVVMIGSLSFVLAAYGFAAVFSARRRTSEGQTFELTVLPGGEPSVKGEKGRPS